MKTVELTRDQTKAVCKELGVSSLLPLIAGLSSRMTCSPSARVDNPIEPHHGPIAMLRTGAKLYWSDSRRVAIVSGYTADGRDVEPYTQDEQSETDYQLWRIARPNSTPIYGWGWEHHAEAMCDRLNDGLEIDLHVAHRVTDLDVIAESGMDACMLEEELGL